MEDNTYKDKQVDKLSKNSRVKPEQWKALEDAQKFLIEVQKRRLERMSRLNLKKE